MTEITIIIVAAAIGLFLLARQIMLWYYKINKRVTILEDILKKLSSIDKKIGLISNEKKEEIGQISSNQ